METTIDISEISALARNVKAAADALPGEMVRAGQASGLAVQRYAQANIPVHTGTAKALTTMKSVSLEGNSVTVLVASTAVSGAGYPYPQVLEYGTRGDIVPVTKRALAFTAKDGKRVVTKRVRQRAGTHFFGRAVDTAKPFILKQFADAIKRVADIIRGS